MPAPQSCTQASNDVSVQHLCSKGSTPHKTKTASTRKATSRPIHNTTSALFKALVAAGPAQQSSPGPVPYLPGAGPLPGAHSSVSAQLLFVPGRWTPLWALAAQ
eukprot:GHUV01036052.1.p1 GENE.GHUV01036052.1~~GHUV01036052.1.p1  ORF type:complete len:104 (+),score=21.47 GHUV01036052.1:148-459(+)